MYRTSIRISGTGHVCMLLHECPRVSRGCTALRLAGEAHGAREINIRHHHTHERIHREREREREPVSIPSNNTTKTLNRFPRGTRAHPCHPPTTRGSSRNKERRIHMLRQNIASCLHRSTLRLFCIPPWSGVHAHMHPQRRQKTCMHHRPHVPAPPSYHTRGASSGASHAQNLSTNVTILHQF